MITGPVNFDREAILRVPVADMTGFEHEYDALVDTGFNAWLTLPSDVISRLQLSWQRFGRGEMADGSETLFNVYEATVILDGHRQTIPVYEMDAQPLSACLSCTGLNL